MTAWYTTDRLHSVVGLTDGSGTILGTITYDGYGQVASDTTGANGDRYKFTGRERDNATGLQHHDYREYDPANGTFTTEDPIGFTAGDPNLRRYVGNGPTNAVDPDGLDKKERVLRTLTPEELRKLGIEIPDIPDDEKGRGAPGGGKGPGGSGGGSCPGNTGTGGTGTGNGSGGKPGDFFGDTTNPDAKKRKGAELPSSTGKKDGAPWSAEFVLNVSRALERFLGRPPTPDEIDRVLKQYQEIFEIMAIFDPTGLSSLAAMVAALSRGDWEGAGLNGIGAIPVLGKGSGIVRGGTTITRVIRAAQTGRKVTETEKKIVKGGTFLAKAKAAADKMRKKAKEDNCPSSETAGAKRGPKPKHTGPHNETIDRRIEELKKKLGDDWEHVGGGSKTERTIDTPGGKKSARRPDITFLNKKTNEEYHENVGKTNANGDPIPREVDALDDLERVLRKRPVFTPWDK